MRPTVRAGMVSVASVISNAGFPLDNKLLASLPRADFDRLLPHLTTIPLPQGDVLYEAGDEVDQIFFPHYGMLSLLAVLRDGKAIETATVGREGVVGAMAGLGPYKSLVRVVVQAPIAVSKIAAPHFRAAVAASVSIRDLCRVQCAALDRGTILPLAAAMRRSSGRRYPAIDAGISCRNVGREAHLGNGGRQQGAKRGNDHLLARRHQNR
jgi:CRP-like cAMP-binding protein